MELLVLSWFILENSNSPGLLGIYAALRFAGTLFAPFIGAVADLISKKTLLLVVRLSYLANATAALYLTITDLLDIWKILLLAAFLGLSKTSEMVIRQAILPDIVGRENLKNGIALERLGSDFTQILGPLIGGFLLMKFGMAASYTMLVTCYALSFVSSLPIDISFQTTELKTNPVLKHKRNILINIRQSFLYVVNAPYLAGLLSIAVIINLTAFPLYFSLIAVLAHEVFETQSSVLGFMLGSYSAGAVLGSLAMGFRLKESLNGIFLAATSILWHFSVIGMAFVSDIGVSYVVLFVSGASQSMCVVLLSTLILNGTPYSLRGRVLGLRQLAVISLPIGLTLSGYLVELAGVKFILMVNGVVGILLIIITLILTPKLLNERESNLCS